MCLSGPSNDFLTDSQQAPDCSPKKVVFNPSISEGFGEIYESYRYHLADKKMELINGSQPSTFSKVVSTWVPANSPLPVQGLCKTEIVNKPTCFGRSGCDLWRYMNWTQPPGSLMQIITPKWELDCSHP